MSSHIVVVTGDDERRTVLLDTLNDAGYVASGASTFDEAKHLLETRSPDLVIADERLGAFNGLHVIVVGRARHPLMKAIVTSRVKDEGLECDAKRLNVQCLVQPTRASDWLASISRTLEVVH
jgi:DNA-binding NtrC family response regulator